MRVQRQAGDSAVLELSRDECLMVNNALNEVCNGVAIDDVEFPTRLGFSRDGLRQLLRQINSLLKQMRPA